MPYANEHACRLREPGDFAAGSFRSMERRHEAKRYRVIVGKLKGKSGRADPMVEQTYRYPADVWTEAEALAHCRAHNGHLFEPATGGGGE
ncbi:MAG TPA: hypothetical protein VEU73_08515 [Gemmatimonadales bacterium]|nr:hypothetical protein [Gemmatimonadales bacterium]